MPEDEKTIFLESLTARKGIGSIKFIQSDEYEYPVAEFEYERGMRIVRSEIRNGKKKFRVAVLKQSPTITLGVQPVIKKAGRPPREKKE